ncbi:hypothetical protein [Saccharibacillus sacchari]|uniref:hypothetical protein n=1 Tax=Saccharibacillus sacchari TaxID=456493 RepID=UPI0004AE2968|nr:hypothetical protein [Saccharibacillus sacchari]
MDKSRNWRIGATSFLVTAAFLAECSAVPVQAAAAMDSVTNERIVSSVSSNPSAALKKKITREANLALRALKDRDFETLADMAAPSGIRFSPYAYVGVGADLVLTPQQIREAWENRKPYIWGLYDGSGEVIRLDFRGYYDRFLNNLPYTAPDGVGYNRIIGSGNTVSNLKEVYPDAQFVEFYVKGGRSGIGNVGGMDWGSLRFVFEQKQGEWKLSGIISDQWTI